MKFGKKIGFLIMSGLLTMGIASTVYASVDTYVIKDSSEAVYEYDLSKLTDDFLNFKMKQSAPLYLSFSDKLSNGGNFYAFHDNSNKYVDYNLILDSFMASKTSGQVFSLDNFCAASTTSKMSNMVSTVKKANLNGNTVSYEDKSTGVTTTSDFDVISID